MDFSRTAYSASSIASRILFNSDCASPRLLIWASLVSDFLIQRKTIIPKVLSRILVCYVQKKKRKIFKHMRPDAISRELEMNQHIIYWCYITVSVLLYTFEGQIIGYHLSQNLNISSLYILSFNNKHEDYSSE